MNVAQVVNGYFVIFAISRRKHPKSEYDTLLKLNNINFFKVTPTARKKRNVLGNK